MKEKYHSLWELNDLNAEYGSRFSIVTNKKAAKSVC